MHDQTGWMPPTWRDLAVSLAPPTDDATPYPAGRVVPPGGRVTVPLLILDNKGTPMSTSLNDAQIADAAGELARAVAGLPADVAREILTDAVRAATLRAHDRRMAEATAGRSA